MVDKDDDEFIYNEFLNDISELSIDETAAATSKAVPLILHPLEEMISVTKKGEGDTTILLDNSKMPFVIQEKSSKISDKPSRIPVEPFEIPKKRKLRKNLRENRKSTQTIVIVSPRPDETQLGITSNPVSINVHNPFGGEVKKKVTEEIE